MGKINPKIYSMEIRTKISNRFATTLVTSKVKNLEKEAKETTFSMLLPENAFVAEFEMEVEGKIYKAYCKEKEEAKQIYNKAVSSGLSAAKVEANTRDSKRFSVTVNIEPESETIFRLTYEELLQRQLGQYELAINIHPGQIVDNLDVQVDINESRKLTFVRTPSLRTGNEIRANDPKLDPSAEIKITKPSSAVVKFKPDSHQQKKFATLLGGKEQDGFGGQFIVQFDVERDPQGGEVLIRDGYFVHFFAPSDLQPLPKHVVFVLDHSGSMQGRKIEQLTEAMKNILAELRENDFFNIVRFSNEASVWNLDKDAFTLVNVPSEDVYGKMEKYLKGSTLPPAVKATKTNIEKAKNIITNWSEMNCTNIIAGLEVALFLIKTTQKNLINHQPMIIFLTDGLPNVGVSSGTQITSIVTELNSGSNKASIFTLSFGSDADKDFLQKLSSQNAGFSKHIYEAADASLQLQNFYKTISSPLLRNVDFKYVDGVTDVTTIDCPILFDGAELVVAGKIDKERETVLRVEATSIRGCVQFRVKRSEPISSIERLWAYLTVKQILKEREKNQDNKELTQKALDLSLKYSFVTPVTSLVVVKPNQSSDSVETKAADCETSKAFPVQFLRQTGGGGGPMAAPPCFRGGGPPMGMLCSMTSQMSSSFGTVFGSSGPSLQYLKMKTTKNAVNNDMIGDLPSTHQTQNDSSSSFGIPPSCDNNIVKIKDDQVPLINNDNLKQLFVQEVDNFENIIKNVETKWRKIEEEKKVANESEAACVYYQNSIVGHKFENISSASFIFSKTSISEIDANFWNMVKDEKIKIIVSLPEAPDQPKLNWPTEIGQKVPLSGMTISLLNMTIKAYWIEREISIDSHVLTHFEFTSWPKNSLPVKAEPFGSFATKVADLFLQKCVSGSPVLVHSVEKYSRGGIFCLLMSGILEVGENATKMPDFEVLALKMKNVLGNKEELKFVYGAFLAFMKQVIGGSQN